MSRKLKTFLKVAAAAIVPGYCVFWLISSLIKEAENHEFREYIRKTYGKGSKYVDTYQD